MSTTDYFDTYDGKLSLLYFQLSELVFNPCLSSGIDIAIIYLLASNESGNNARNNILSECGGNNARVWAAK
ncbi:hypothetical protein [Hafnia psychrotolerans]|uniref:Uncharacterized protein n=1 Tax=Hafnia psychrotolerans TaxID=1477018 RepID=A0ABQ1G2T1_9GAMM|nr:hypothetical protein [Hafnia psychrotolerans]GGA35594.1 hypothetical protein GCM10011328_07990 [Hafnia psychrotolerans]